MPSDQNLIGAIYDAAVNHTLWPDVVAQIADYCGAERVMLAITDTLRPHSNFQQTYNIPSEHVAAWREGLDEQEVELHNRWITSVSLCEPISSDDYFGGPEQFLAAGGDFGRMLNSQGIRRQMVMAFELDHFRLSGIGLNNGEPFASYARQHLQSLAPHLRRAFEIYHQLAALKQENAELYQLLELMAAGVILLDANQRVRYTTQHARQMIIDNGKLFIRQGTLCVLDTAYQAQLKALIAGAISVAQRENHSQAGGVVQMIDGKGGGLALSVVPLSSMAAYQSLYSDKIAAAIFISPIGEHIELPLSALGSLYALTTRELQLCQEFVNKIDLNEVAVSLNLKLSSVRSLLKSIYYKTDQTSQAGLMKLLMESRLNFRHV